MLREQEDRMFLCLHGKTHSREQLRSHTDCLPTAQHTSIGSLLIQNIYTAVWHTRCWGDELP